jgi:hypothetical protein
MNTIVPDITIGKMKRALPSMILLRVLAPPAAR